MIDLTPLEVRKKKADFRRGIRGYETQEVDDFLDLVAERMEELVRENISLKDRVGQLGESVDSFRTREQAMNEALVSAQELRKEIRGQAERESALALKEARSEGERMVESARKEVEQYREMLEQLHARRDRFLRNYRNFLETQMAEVGREEERILRSRTGELAESGEEIVVD